MVFLITEVKSFEEEEAQEVKSFEEEEAQDLWYSGIDGQDVVCT